MINRFLDKYLDPLDRLQELIYGVLIVMTFTMAFSAFGGGGSTEIGQQDVSDLFLAAFGCTVAWGLIDGVMSILSGLAERGQTQRMVVNVREAGDEQTALAAIADELDATLAPVTSDEERQNIYAGVLAQIKDNEPRRVGVTRDDILGAVGLVIIAIFSTLPVVIPFLFIKHPSFALRTSNFIAILMLFGAGYYYGKYAGGKALKIGLSLAALGVAMVLVAIPLGG